jgi:type II secretory ATPase GspE/PulE/Tfp pilus assembly ATPase PilB-like protein
MARLASYKTAVPQDGKFAVDDVEVRVATSPTQFGEKAVLRLLTPSEGMRALEELGFWPEELAELQRMADQPQGLVLATGPAGSGKTTTLLALMRWLYRRHQQRLGPTPGAALNVVTLEDPVEIVIPEFNQTSIQADNGMTFATGLRSLLRQDPELILVGEIRDNETAAAVIQTSLTGHMCFSTLHARNSLGVIPRLLEMGVQPYPLAASLSGVIYQRLVRSLCPVCRREAQPPLELDQERKKLGLPSAPCWEPVGCPQCANRGYQGRAAVPELLVVDDDLRQGILAGTPRPQLVGLRQRALERVARGETSYAEVCRLVPAS